MAVWAAIGFPGRATYGGRTTADEPQYLLSAISLAEDLDLDIADELAQERWRDFHEADLPEQTQPRADGSRLSPHDPLLPVLLAVPVGIGGWVGGKLALAAMAGALAAALVWVAVRRLRVPPRVAVPVVLAFSLAPPLVAYGTQVYPELSAALAVTGAVAGLTGSLDRRNVALVVLSVVALPWLGVKYAPVAAVLAALLVVALWRRGESRRAAGVVGGFVVAAAVFGLLHQVVYGGWTVYAAGDHFVGDEFTVTGNEPDYLGRSERLVGLLVDRDFGLAAWAPAFLVAVPALAALARRRPPFAGAVLLPLAAGWLTATFVALTMHGWWWPGRQVVVVVPLIVLAVAWRAAEARSALRWTVAAGAVAAIGWLWLVVEVLAGQLRLIIDFDQTTFPLLRAWHWLLPDFRDPSARTTALAVAWIAALAGLAAAGWRSASGSWSASPTGPSGPRLGPAGLGSGGGAVAGADEDAVAGEGADADVTAVDLDRDRSVR